MRSAHDAADREPGPHGVQRSRLACSRAVQPACPTPPAGTSVPFAWDWRLIPTALARDKPHGGPARAGQGAHRSRDEHARAGQGRLFCAPGPRPYDPVMARKGFLTTLMLLTLLIPAISRTPMTAAAADNPVVTENQQSGSSGWQLGSLIAYDPVNQIKGHASATSVLQGNSLTLYVTVYPAESYSIELY